LYDINLSFETIVFGKTFMKDELDDILSRLKKPAASFAKLDALVNQEAQRAGYEDYEDMLLKTGWYDREYE
jgi:hypothetical protein